MDVKPAQHAASATRRLRIGVDLGGTKIEAIALDSSGRSLIRRREPTPRGDYDRTLAAIVDLVTSIEQEAGETGHVGVGIPGTISEETGLVKNANSTWLNGRALGEDLRRKLSRPVRVANDANCFALSEATDGAASSARVVFGVIVGTGTGGGLVVDGRVVSGANGIAGEWGHNPLPWPRPEEWPGPACYCGRTGCIETFLSGPGLARDFTADTGEDMAPPEIVKRAEAHDARAAACLDRYADRFARALSSVLNIIDPDVVVLGGGLSNVERLYGDIREKWSAYVFSDTVRTRLVRARHGDSSGVRGAAWLWDRGTRS
ncbi:MAG: ROK family protein [Acidobacteriota bacterium]